MSRDLSVILGKYTGIVIPLTPTSRAPITDGEHPVDI